MKRFVQLTFAACLALASLAASFPYVTLNNKTNRLSDNGSALTFNGSALGSGSITTNAPNIAAGSPAVFASSNVLGAATSANLSNAIGSSVFVPIGGGAMTGPLTINGNPVLTNASGALVSTVITNGFLEITNAPPSALMKFYTTSNATPFQFNISSEWYPGGSPPFNDDVVVYGWNLAASGLVLTNQPGFGIISEREFQGAGAIGDDFEYHMIRQMTNGTQDRLWTWNAERNSNRVKHAERSDTYTWINSTTNDLNLYMQFSGGASRIYVPHTFDDTLTFGTIYGNGGGYFNSTNAVIKSPTYFMGVGGASSVAITNTMPMVTVNENGNAPGELIKLVTGGQLGSAIGVYDSLYSSTIPSLQIRPLDVGGVYFNDSSSNGITFSSGAAFSQTMQLLPSAISMQQPLTVNAKVFAHDFGASTDITNYGNIYSRATGNVFHQIRSTNTTGVAYVDFWNDSPYNSTLSMYGSLVTASGSIQRDGMSLHAGGPGGLAIQANHNNAPGIMFFTAGSDTVAAAKIDKNANLFVTGGFSTAVFTTATNYTASLADSLILINGSNTTNTLPTAVGVKGREYTFKVIDPATNALIATTSSQVIDGATTYSLTASNKYVHVKSDNAKWWVIGNN